ncbi:LysR family transcriptional regulator [Entomobacter blattae]|uniref:HTH-type transcriptional regulator DmlR n=1 Tax=Entomobacter blattae TaxID=2762277 RepID=A0A7H1NNL8_9PROT|nr:LysR family transcriptional regulator [Entomobacter blattae]QNT77378.1 HTH-type transcriptional regulator DmlR [Entomobacter blattae]
MDWDKLRIFHTVAQAGSFTHAGDLLNLSQSAVSRQISALEESLKLPLFHRHARGLLLTEQGELLNKTVQDVFAKLAMTEALLSESKEKTQGHLTITTTTGFGSAWLAKHIARFLKTHPDITLSLILDDNDLNLSMREADVAIRMHPPHQSDLIQRHIADISLPLFSSTEYLSTYGEPKTLEDLDKHKIILFGGHDKPVPHVNWLRSAGLPSGQQRKATLEVNNLIAIASAIVSGMGIGALPQYIYSSFPDMVPILPDVKTPTINTYFVYPEELKASKKIALFRDFLIEELKQKP